MTWREKLKIFEQFPIRLWVISTPQEYIMKKLGTLALAISFLFSFNLLAEEEQSNKEERKENRQEIREDRKELHEDRKELREDRKAARKDRHAARKEKRAERKEKRRH
jgi:hypothetical protein